MLFPASHVFVSTVSPSGSLCVFRNTILLPKLKMGLLHDAQHMAVDV